MKTFKQYLTEVQSTHSVASSIIGAAGTAPPFILTPTMLKRLDYSIPNVTAFHVTSRENIEYLVKGQGKKSVQLSVFLSTSDMGRDILAGVETRGGVVAELEGTIDAYFAMDAFTARLKGGRRSVLVGLNSDFGSATMQVYDKLKDGAAFDVAYKLLKSMSKELQKLRLDVMEKYVTPFLAKNFGSELGRSTVQSARSYFELFRIIVDELEYEAATVEDILRELPGGTKVMANIVKDYLDGSEAIMKKTPDYKKLFVMPFARIASYDEAIMSNYRIKKLHFYGGNQSAARAYGEDFNVATEAWDDDDKLIEYIEYKGEKVSEILYKKVTK